MDEHLTDTCALKCLLDVALLKGLLPRRLVLGPACGMVGAGREVAPAGKVADDLLDHRTE